MAFPATDLSQITTGEFVDASDWNAFVDAANLLADPPACRVYHDTNQSYASSGTPTASAFNQERYDTDSMHTNAANTKITFTTAGLYTVTGCGSFAVTTGGDRFIGIRLNGTTYIAQSVHSSSSVFAGNVACATTYKFAAADYVELMFAQNSGGALNLLSAGNYSPEFAATWVGRG